ncbi:MAG: hypothetical protein ACR2OZ_08860 [Verrucomicrobiales bacterium]
MTSAGSANLFPSVLCPREQNRPLNSKTFGNQFCGMGGYENIVTQMSAGNLPVAMNIRLHNVASAIPIK